MNEIRLKVGRVNVLVRRWDSRSLYRKYVQGHDGVTVISEDHECDHFITVENDRLSAHAQEKFLIGIPDWTPSFTTFVTNSCRELLICGCNDGVYSMDVFSGLLQHFQVIGFFRQFVYLSQNSIVVDAEAGVYSLSWKLEQLWHTSTDLIQSLSVSDHDIVLKTDSGDIRLDLHSGTPLHA